MLFVSFFLPLETQENHPGDLGKTLYKHSQPSQRKKSSTNHRDIQML